MSRLQTAWQKVRFDEICKNISDRIDDPKQAGTNYYVGLEHLEPEELKIRKNGTPDDVNATKLKFKPGQILFGKRRWYQRKLAVAEHQGICSAHMMVLEAKEGKIVKKFLPLFMQGEEFFERALMISEGSLSPTIKWKNLARQEFLIPPPSEQEPIVSTIHQIDDTISKTQDLLEKIQTYKNSQAIELLTKGIGHTKFKKIKSRYEKFQEVPEFFKVKKLGELVKLSSGEFLPAENRQGGEIPIFGGNGIIGFYDDYLIQQPTIVIGRVGVYCGCLYMTKGKSWITDNAIYVKEFNNDIEPEYLYRYLQIEDLNSFAEIAAHPKLTQKPLCSILIPYPEKITDQREIISRLNSTEQKIHQVNNHIKKLKLMRKSILNSKLTPPIQEVKLVVQ